MMAAFPNRKLQQCWFLLMLHHFALVASGRGRGRVSHDGCYTSLFSFGDSLTDTGNTYFIYPPQSPNCLIPPYGDTYFHHPNGRCSDGRLIPDFIADYMGIPHLKPYLGFKNGSVPRHSIQHGLNFAVAGATALDRTFFQEKGFVVDSAVANYSLMVQLDWFKDVLTYLCTSPSSCKEFIGSSLFIVGEIGGNDYGYPLSETTDFQVLRSYVTQVVSVVSSVIIELIDLGARILMVPGSLPLGCNPAYLTRFAVMEKDEYDQSGCLKWLNNFFGYHNQLLQVEIRRLQVLYPHVNIIYADYFHDALRMFQSPNQFGFGTDFNKVCCGGGGPYNFNDSALCGDAGIIACVDPSKNIYWDGYHLTEAAYRWMAKGLVYGPYTIPKLSLHCITIERPLEI